MRSFVLVVAALLAGEPARAAAPVEVVVSIRPVQAIAAAVMAGVGVPRVLLPGASPHGHVLRPSEARLLSDADVVFWIGPALEPFLAKPLETVAPTARVVALLGAPGLELLPRRAGGLHQAAAAPPPAGVIDPHIWLDPRNAVAMANAVAETLAVVDPVNAQDYWSNAEAFSREAMAFDKELHVRLAPVRDKPFLVFHDATQYFEARYRLAALGSINVTPDQPPGARRIADIQAKLREANAVCIFSEPQFETRAAQMLADGSGARTGVLDPEGTKAADGPGMYFSIVRGLADAFLRCLG